MGNAKSMSLGPDAAAVVTKAVSQMPSPPMQEVAIVAAGELRKIVSELPVSVLAYALRSASPDPLLLLVFCAGLSFSPALLLVLSSVRSLIPHVLVSVYLLLYPPVCPFLPGL